MVFLGIKNALFHFEFDSCSVKHFFDKFIRIREDLKTSLCKNNVSKYLKKSSVKIIDYD